MLQTHIPLSGKYAARSALLLLPTYPDLSKGLGTVKGPCRAGKGTLIWISLFLVRSAMDTRAAAVPVNVPALIDHQKISGSQVLTAVLCAAVVFMDGFDAQAIGYVAPSLSRAWQLPPGALGPVFGIGLFGLTVGALVFGPAADRFGRKPVIVLSTLGFGLCTLLTVSADSLASLMAWRFVTGLGLGGAMPNTIAITSEFSPLRSRTTMVMVMFIGFSLGSALGGVVTAQLVPLYGWTAVFWVGGLFPLVLLPVLLLWLPESVRLLALRGTEDERIGRILQRINPQLVFASGTKFVAPEEHPSGWTVRHLFTEGRALGTILLWIMFFMNLLDLYFLANWLPTVINNAGVSVRLAVMTAALVQVGGIVGTLILARLMDRFSPYWVLVGTFFLAGVFIASIGLAGATIGLIIPAVFATGFCVVGAQIGSNALAATYYPTFIRSTGVGWALGIGRIGSIVGPVVGGIMLSLQWHISVIFLAGAIPVFVAACAVFIMGLMKRSAVTAPPQTAGWGSG